jgi:hypothetical protein
VARRHAEEATREVLRLDSRSPDGQRPDA